jgi:hypothetical protein
MSCFWLSINLVLLAAYLAMVAAFPYREFHRAAAYLIIAVLLGVVWAVLFRLQIESRRVSLAAIRGLPLQDKSMFENSFVAGQLRSAPL